MKFVSAWLSLEQRWNGSAIEKHVCLNITPHFCKPEGKDDGATTLYALRHRVSVRRSKVSSKSTKFKVGVVCGSYHVASVNETMESRGNSESGSSAQRSSFNFKYVFSFF